MNSKMILAAVSVAVVVCLCAGCVQVADATDAETVSGIQLLEMADDGVLTLNANYIVNTTIEVTSDLVIDGQGEYSITSTPEVATTIQVSSNGVDLTLRNIEINNQFTQSSGSTTGRVLMVDNSSDVSVLVDNATFASVAPGGMGISVAGINNGEGVDPTMISNVSVYLNRFTYHADNAQRGVSFYAATDCSLRITDSDILVNYYAINLASYTVVDVYVDDSRIQGWTTLNSYSVGSEIEFHDCELIGYNDFSYNADGWNNFATIVLDGGSFNDIPEGEAAFNNRVFLDSCNIRSVTVNGNEQSIIACQYRAGSNIATFNGCTFEVEGELASGDKMVASIYNYGSNNSIVVDGITYDLLTDDTGLQAYRFPFEPIYMVGSVGYWVVNDATADAAASGNPLILNTDMMFSAGNNLIVPDGITLTVDLNGHSITTDDTFSGSVIMNYGTLTVTGNGTVDLGGCSGTCSAITNNGVLTIEDGTYIGGPGEQSVLISLSSGTASIQGGSYSSPDTILSVSDDATVAITGGTFNVSVTDLLTDSYIQDFRGTVVPVSNVIINEDKETTDLPGGTVTAISDGSYTDVTINTTPNENTEITYVGSVGKGEVNLTSDSIDLGDVQDFPSEETSRTPIVGVDVTISGNGVVADSYTATVSIRLDIPIGLRVDPDSVKVYYHDNDATEIMDAALSDDGLTVVFTTTHNSPYYIYANYVPEADIGESGVWYIDSVNGNDSNDGMTPQTAWRSSSSLNNSSIKDGDTVMITGTFTGVNLDHIIRIQSYGDGAAFTGQLKINWASISDRMKDRISGAYSFSGITFNTMTIQDEGAHLNYDLSSVSMSFQDCTFQNSRMSLPLYGNYGVTIDGCTFIGSDRDADGTKYTVSTYGVFANHSSYLIIRDTTFTDFTRGVNADNVGNVVIEDCEFSIGVTINRGTPDTEIRQIQFGNSIGNTTVSDVVITSTVGGNALSIHESVITSNPIVVKNCSITGFTNGIVYQVSSGTWSEDTEVDANGNYFVAAGSTEASEIQVASSDGSVSAETVSGLVTSEIYYTDSEMTVTNKGEVATDSQITDSGDYSFTGDGDSIVIQADIGSEVDLDVILSHGTVSLSGTVNSTMVSVSIEPMDSIGFGGLQAYNVEITGMTISGNIAVTLDVDIPSGYSLEDATVWYYTNDMIRDSEMTVTALGADSVTFTTPHNSYYAIETSLIENATDDPSPIIPGGSNDDDDFVPPSLVYGDTDSGSDDTTTIVACAAAAVVAAILAVFLIMEYRKK